MDRQTLRSIGCTASTPPGRWAGRPQGAGSATAAGPGATAGTGSLPGERPRVGRDGVVRWRLADLCVCTVLTPWSSGVSASAIRSAAWASWSGRSASAGSRPGRSTPNPIPRRRPSSKKTCRPDRRHRRRQGAGQAARDLVPGREPDRPEGRADPALGRAGAPAAAQTEHRRCRCWARRGSRPRQPRDQRTPPPTSLPRCARRASGPPRSSCPRSTPRP